MKNFANIVFPLKTPKQSASLIWSQNANSGKQSKDQTKRIKQT